MKQRNIEVDYEMLLMFTTQGFGLSSLGLKLGEVQVHRQGFSLVVGAVAQVLPQTSPR